MAPEHGRGRRETAVVTGTVTLPDGRALGYEEYGDPAGFPVLSFHGGLSSRLDAAPADSAARLLGVRLIAPDRPGMGLSTFQPRRRLTDWPADVSSLADSLEIQQFAVMGWSLGGAYAAACAALLGERVTAAALLSSSVPLDLYGTTRGLTLEDRALLVLAHRAPWLASALIKASIVHASNTALLKAVMRTVPQVDRVALRQFGPPELAMAFVREAVRQGPDGCVEDYRIFGEPWGFPLDVIAVPVHIWEGAADSSGPVGYREFLARHIPHATVTVVPDEGHISLLPNQAPVILAELLGGDHNAESTARWNVG